MSNLGTAKLTEIDKLLSWLRSKCSKLLSWMYTE